jgi:hypothetical protein
MPASATKDRFTVIGIHPVPTHMSAQEFRGKVEMNVDAHLARPIAERSFLKYDIVRRTIVVSFISTVPSDNGV